MERPNRYAASLALALPLAFLVIRPSHARASLGTNVNVTHEAGAQSETSIAVNPTNPRNILLGVNDLTASAKLYESVDGGRTFASANFVSAMTGVCYDTSLAFNSQGDAFFTSECSDQRIAYRKARQRAWTETSLSIAGSSPDGGVLVVDNAAHSPFRGSVYIGYVDSTEDNTPYVLFSRDGFGEWKRGAAIPETSTTGVSVATDSNGSVFAVWENFAQRTIQVAASDDGGASFGPVHLVTTYRMDTTGFSVPIPPQNFRGIVPVPRTAVDEAGSHPGRLYVTYTDQDPAGAGTSIILRHSDDDGASWSAAVKINDDSPNSYDFEPAIAVAPDGTVGVSFYDTRNDPASRKVDRYVSFSRDGGDTWTANQRVTDALSDETASGADSNQYGDYQAMAADSKGGFHLAWTDSRKPGALDEDVFYSTVSDTLTWMGL